MPGSNDYSSSPKWTLTCRPSLCVFKGCYFSVVSRTQNHWLTNELQAKFYRSYMETLNNSVFYWRIICGLGFFPTFSVLEIVQFSLWMQCLFSEQQVTKYRVSKSPQYVNDPLWAKHNTLNYIMLNLIKHQKCLIIEAKCRT